MMDTAFQFTQNSILSNHTIQIKGWPGPIIRQKDMYPPNIPTPKTPAELQKDALDRFNSELALFLLVAEAKDFWIYSWFWVRTTGCYSRHSALQASLRMCGLCSTPAMCLRILR